MKPDFNRYLKLGFVILFVALAECCKSPQQTFKENSVIENTVTEELDDTTTIITTTEETTSPTADGGIKKTTNEKKRIIKHKSKTGREHQKINKDEQKVDGLTPILEKEKTKRIKSNNKTTAKLAKEERKGLKFNLYVTLLKRLIIFFAVGLLLYFWVKRR